MMRLGGVHKLGRVSLRRGTREPVSCRDGAQSNVSLSRAEAMVPCVRPGAGGAPRAL